MSLVNVRIVTHYEIQCANDSIGGGSWRSYSSNKYLTEEAAQADYSVIDRDRQIDYRLLRVETKTSNFEVTSSLRGDR